MIEYDASVIAAIQDEGNKITADQHDAACSKEMGIVLVGTYDANKNQASQAFNVTDPTVFEIFESLISHGLFEDVTYYEASPLWLSKLRLAA